MFIFDSKRLFTKDMIHYKWMIVYNDTVIGTMNLMFEPNNYLSNINAMTYIDRLMFEPNIYLSHINATAYIDRAIKLPKNYLEQIMKDFIYLVNNDLMGIDEPHSRLYTVEVLYDNYSLLIRDESDLLY